MSKQSQNLSKFLQEKRKERDMSLRDFSEVIGISHSYLHKLERGVDPKTAAEVSPTIDTLMKIAESLEIPLVRLMEICEYIDPKDQREGNRALDISEMLNTLKEKFENASSKITFNKKIVDKDDLNLLIKNLEDVLDKLS